MLAPRKKLWSTPPSAVDAALDMAALDANDVVYDVGCGDGRVLIQMASRCAPLMDESSSERLGGGEGQVVSEGKGASAPHEQEQLEQREPRLHHCHTFVGIEISPERAEEARRRIRQARDEGRMPSHVSIEILCANALDADSIDYARATVIFLYLVPRGLRLIKDIVWPAGKGNESETATAAAEAGEAIASRTNANEGMAHPTPRNRPRRIITYMAPFEDTPHVRKECCAVEHQEGAAWPVYLYHANME